MALLCHWVFVTLILCQQLHAVPNMLFGFDITTQISLNANASSTNMVVVTAYNMGHVYQCGVNVIHDQTHYECNSSHINTINCSDNTNLFKFIEIDTKQLSQQAISITKVFLNNTIAGHFCFDGRCSNTLSVLKNSLISINSNGDCNDAASRTLCKEDAQLRFGFHQSYKDWVWSYPTFVVINLHWGFYQYKCFAEIEAKENQTYACNSSHHATFNKEDLNKFEFSMQLDNAEDDGILLDTVFAGKDSNMIIFNSFCGEIFDYKCVNEYEMNAKHYPHTFFSLFNATTDKVHVLPQQYESIFTIPHDQEVKYVIVPEKMTWRKAYDYCNVYYDGLAMPKTRNDLIALILLKNELYFEEDVWIGLTDMEFNGSVWNVAKNGNAWIFINNQSVNINGTRYRLWAPGEPNNDDNEHCGGIHFDSSKQNYINDFYCHLEAIFACTRKVDIPLPKEQNHMYKMSVWVKILIGVMGTVIVLFIAVFSCYWYFRAKRLSNSPQYKRTNTDTVTSGVAGEGRTEQIQQERGFTCVQLTDAEMEQARQAMAFPQKILSIAMMAKSGGLSENSSNTLSLPSVATGSHNDTSQENETITKDLQDLDILPSYENA
eukprot:270772_1